MLKKLFKQFVNNEILNNERGNVLAIALIIITVLTFSVSTITGMSINLATSTTTEISNLGEENEAKAKIRLAISDFEEEVGTNLMTYTEYDNEYIYGTGDTHGVTVENVTSTIPELAGAGTTAQAYKFSVTLSDGRVISMYDYASTVGVNTTNFDEFAYSIGTNGSLVMNSGYYSSFSTQNNKTEDLNIFGDNIFLSKIAPYTISGTSTQAVTSNNLSTYPVLTTTQAAFVHYNTSFQYCGSSDCYNTNNIGNPYEMDLDEFSAVGAVPTDQGTPADITLVDYFGDFDWNENFITYMEEDAPTGTRTITAEYSTIDNDVYNNSTMFTVTVNTNKKGKITGYTYNWPNDDFTNITDYESYIEYDNMHNENASFVYFGTSLNPNFSGVDYDVPNSGTALEIDTDIKTSKNLNDMDDTLVVFGDLHLNQTTGTQSIRGEVVVIGDLYLEGSEKDFEGSIFVAGRTYVDLNADAQIVTTGGNMGMTLMAKDSVYFQSHDESTTDVQSELFYMYIYTDESIYFETVNSRVYFSGAMFARALGEVGSGDASDMTWTYLDGTTPITGTTRGIVINSCFGYVDDSGVFHEGQNGSDSYRFNYEVMTSNNFSNNFVNIPTFNSVVISTGELNFYTSEFSID